MESYPDDGGDEEWPDDEQENEFWPDEDDPLSIIGGVEQQPTT